MKYNCNKEMFKHIAAGPELLEGGNLSWDPGGQAHRECLNFSKEKRQESILRWDGVGDMRTGRQRRGRKRQRHRDGLRLEPHGVSVLGAGRWMSCPRTREPGTPNVLFEVVCLDVVSISFPSPPTTLWPALYVIIEIKKALHWTSGWSRDIQPTISQAAKDKHHRISLSSRL